MFQNLLAGIFGDCLNLIFLAIYAPISLVRCLPERHEAHDYSFNIPDWAPRLRVEVGEGQTDFLVDLEPPIVGDHLNTGRLHGVVWRALDQAKIESILEVPFKVKHHEVPGENIIGVRPIDKLVDKLSMLLDLSFKLFVTMLRLLHKSLGCNLVCHSLKL